MAAQQRAAKARAVAEARQASLWARAASDAARLARADEARDKGDVALASRLYVRLALSRSPNPSTLAAKERLKQLAADGRQKLREIDAALAEEAVSPGELAARGIQSSIDRPTPEREAQIVAAFRRYDQLAEDYHEVPVAAGEIKKHVAQQRRRPEFAAVLSEPKAKALWEVAQQHEKDEHACCAYWVYLQAAKLAPAPSARLAEQRSVEMAKDPELMASAKACRETQQCHAIYNRATQLTELNPGRAKELFAEILARAPSDSEVYRAAQRHLGSAQE
jgi:hypothetical protein